MPNRSIPRDKELIRLFLYEGDGVAFSLLIERYRSRCRSLLYSICAGDEFLMDEAEQEIFIALEKGLDRFRGEASFSTFFYRFARNKGIDVVRRERRRQFLSLNMLRERGEEPADRRKGPEEEVLAREKRREDQRKLRRVLSRLREEERTILILKDMEGLSYEEIGEIIRRPVGTVRSRLHRARRKAAEIGRSL